MGHRGAIRIGRVGDPPLINRGVVDPSYRQGGAVGRPPVPPEAVQLFGGNEVRHAPGDVAGVVVAGDQALVGGTVDRSDA